MENKIVLITGATDGIGKETAKALAKKGYKVILHGRNEQKAQAVMKEIKAETQNADLDILLCNLLSFADIKRMTDEFYRKYDRLDVLINNAGAVFSTERQLTEDGQERTFQLNVFAPFLLTRLLLPALRKSRSARVIIESSASHSSARKPDFEDMTSEKDYGAQPNYSLSKLYAIWMGQYFAKFLNRENIRNVTVNITHPGAVATDFGQNEKKGFMVDLIYKVALRFMAKPEDGAKSEIYLATSPEVEGVSGKYFSHQCKEDTPNPKHYSLENEKKLWTYCEKATQAYLN
ncbi:SDR family oxidoreductase [Saccharibacillus sacchari]|uniref:SDR family oxidoreductase n=1 Tax=Saccharibacillus sacchari TaxID=456493 RepID=A0ACC6PE40_9BACL